jgi:4-hydroxy-tetrahydrodipicolinate synthase
MAEREGADGVSVITPYFVSPSQAELALHYRRVAEATSLPVMLYSNPATCGGLKIDVDTVAQLARIPNIRGIKDSSGDFQTTNEYLRVVPDGFAVMQGRDTLIYPSLIFGAAGAVPATGNIAPALLVSIYEAFRRGDHEAAKAAQLRLNPLRMSLTLGTAPGGVKAALTLMGESIGPCRSPVGPLSAEKQQTMRGVLEKVGLLGKG